MTRLFILAAIFCLAAPAALAVPPAGQGPGQGQGQGQSDTPSATPTASELCKQQRRSMGMNTFRATYAPTGSPKAAMNACLAQQVQVTTTAAKNAAKACKAEQVDPSFATAHGGKSFADHYATNANKKNAFGKCVSSKATAAVESQQDATLNAAKKCKAERADANFAATHGGKSFADHYATNANKKNAFGKCVSKLAKEQ
ncbi:MAG TPA: hypothetical protein VFR38_08060, partial [Gaiellaceae bacterium]|nr:hypothetical protein [Gaiellaceae bacterium]